MLPQIQQIQDGTDEQKAALVSQGIATLHHETGELFLSLPAVDQLGMALLSKNPLVLVGHEMEENGVSRKVCAEPDAGNARLAKQLTEDLYRTLRLSCELGIPINLCFTAFMAQEAHERDQADYTQVLTYWQHLVKAQAEQEQAAAGTQLS